MQALRHPQAVARGSVVELEHPVLGRMSQVAPPFASVGQVVQEVAPQEATLVLLAQVPPHRW